MPPFIPPIHPGTHRNLPDNTDMSYQWPKFLTRWGFPLRLRSGLLSAGSKWGRCDRGCDHHDGAAVARDCGAGEGCAGGAADAGGRMCGGELIAPRQRKDSGWTGRRCATASPRAMSSLSGATGTAMSGGAAGSGEKRARITAISGSVPASRCPVIPVARSAWHPRSSDRGHTRVAGRSDRGGR